MELIRILLIGLVLKHVYNPTVVYSRQSQSDITAQAQKAGVLRICAGLG